MSNADSFDSPKIGVWSKYIAALDQHEKLFYDNADIQRDDAAALVDHVRRFVEMVVAASE